MILFTFSDEQQEDKILFEALYTECFDSLYNYAYSRLGSSEDAQEVVHDTYVNIYKNLHKIRGAERSKCRKFLFITLLRVIYQKWRDNNRSQNDISVDDAQLPDGDDTTWEQVLENLGREQLTKFFRSLSDLDALLVHEHFILGLTYNQLAEKTGISAKNVSVRLSRIKKAAMKLVNGEEVHNV